MPVTIRISLVPQQSFELTCGSQSRLADWKEIESLTNTADRDYFGIAYSHDPHWAPKFSQLTALGHGLYQWLDGPEGWLRTGFADRETAVQLLVGQALWPAKIRPEKLAGGSACPTSCRKV